MGTSDATSQELGVRAAVSLEGPSLVAESLEQRPCIAPGCAGRAEEHVERVSKDKTDICRLYGERGGLGEKNSGRNLPGRPWLLLLWNQGQILGTVSPLPTCSPYGSNTCSGLCLHHLINPPSNVRMQVL